MAQVAFLALVAVPVWDSHLGEQLMHGLWAFMNGLYTAFPVVVTGWMVLRSMKRTPVKFSLGRQSGDDCMP